ncbi:MAG: hypothetical protein EZS28_004976 [Streblomastix strix]|uniref:Uncharacterized protein n=1 Tax=Streblomastix strix TaxID=222440 RepID=A0A5J4WWS7_9EUKA|nr:MAG: hypothetical protein EZS28_004976 [Streblomastix strix]
MTQIRGGTNDILINKTFKHLAAYGLSQCFVWLWYHMPLIDDQIKVVEQDSEESRWILGHGESRKHSLNLMVFYDDLSVQARPFILTILTQNLPQLESGTPQKTISLGIGQYHSDDVVYVFIALNGTSIITPQFRFPATMLSSGDTLTELLAQKSFNEFEHIAACSLAQIDVAHNFILSQHIANQLNGPHAVENPNQKRKTSVSAYSYDPYAILTVCSAVIPAFLLKLTAGLAVVSVLIKAGGIGSTTFKFEPLNKQLILQLLLEIGYIQLPRNLIMSMAGMIHPAIGGALGAGANLAEAVDRLINKR